MVDQLRAYSIWNAIHGDPDLIDGITFGELDELMVYVAGQHELLRDASVGLFKRVMKTAEAGMSDIGEMIEVYRELLNLPSVRKHLDGLTG